MRHITHSYILPTLHSYLHNVRFYFLIGVNREMHVAKTRSLLLLKNAVMTLSTRCKSGFCRFKVWMHTVGYPELNKNQIALEYINLSRSSYLTHTAVTLVFPQCEINFQLRLFQTPGTTKMLISLFLYQIFIFLYMNVLLLVMMSINPHWIIIW